MLCITRLAVFAALSASTAAMAQPADGSSKRFEQMLQKWDANGDGRISLDEYLAAAGAHFQQIDTQNKGAVSAEQIADSPKAQERIERRTAGLVHRLDTAGNGYVTQSEFVAAAQKRFARLDRNGDGKLTPDELDSGRRGQTASGKRAQFAQHRFDPLDANHDGIVTADEFVADAVAKFKELDVAGNGRVTAEEIANSPRAHARAEHVAAHVAKRLDTNGDGMVSKDEFLAAARERFAKLDRNGDGFLTVDEIGRRRERGL